MKIKRKEFKDKLVLLSPALATREITEEQSTCIVFREDYMYTFDVEVSCRVDFETGVEGAVPGRRLIDVLKKHPVSEIDFKQMKDGTICIRSRGDETTINVQKEIVLTEVEPPKRWNKIPEKFTEAVECVASCVSRDEQSPLACIHLHPEYIEACDNYHAIRYPIETKIKKEVLIRGPSLATIIGREVTHMAEDKEWVYFKSDDLMVACARWEMDYPSTDEMFNTKGSKVTLPAGVANSIQLAELFSSDNFEENLLNVQLMRGEIRMWGEGPMGRHRAKREIDYNNDRKVDFLISPTVLKKATGHDAPCTIGKELMKIEAKDFVFAAVLGA